MEKSAVPKGVVVKKILTILDVENRKKINT